MHKSACIGTGTEQGLRSWRAHVEALQRCGLKYSLEAVHIVGSVSGMPLGFLQGPPQQHRGTESTHSLFPSVNIDPADGSLCGSRYVSTWLLKWISDFRCCFWSDNSFQLCHLEPRPDLLITVLSVCGMLYQRLFRYPRIEVEILLLKLRVTWSVSLIHCEVVLWLARNPNWLVEGRSSKLLYDW
jgi:hypothetical protein